MADCHVNGRHRQAIRAIIIFTSTLSMHLLEQMLESIDYHLKYKKPTFQWLVCINSNYYLHY